VLFADESQTVLTNEVFMKLFWLLAICLLPFFSKEGLAAKEQYACRLSEHPKVMAVAKAALLKLNKGLKPKSRVKFNNEMATIPLYSWGEGTESWRTEVLGLGLDPVDEESAPASLPRNLFFKVKYTLIDISEDGDDEYKGVCVTTKEIIASVENISSLNIK
jgi:hypothetical protein